MKPKNHIHIIIKRLNTFISGTDRSLTIAGKIEVALDEAFPDDEEIQNYVTCFASYRPEGGEYLYDEIRMAEESKKLLRILQGKHKSLDIDE